MGSSFVDLDGSGFEANDALLEFWLSLLVDEIDKLGEAPAWIHEMRAEWEIQATAGFSFGITPDLDRFALDGGRRRIISALVRRALERLGSYAPTLTAEQLNLIEHGNTGVYMESLPTAMLEDVGRKFLALLGDQAENGDDGTKELD